MVTLPMKPTRREMSLQQTSRVVPKIPLLPKALPPKVVAEGVKPNLPGAAQAEEVEGVAVEEPAEDVNDSNLKFQSV